MKIDDRIAFHEEQRVKLDKRKERVCNELNDINQKNIHHWDAIQNLLKKKMCLKDVDM